MVVKMKDKGLILIEESNRDRGNWFSHLRKLPILGYERELLFIVCCPRVTKGPQETQQ
jgi:hypothetical protein